MNTPFLTAKQTLALSHCARLSPGYTFATEPGSPLVMVWRDGKEDHYVGLVGRKFAQYYDRDPVTEKVIRRVAGRVFRLSCIRFS